MITAVSHIFVLQARTEESLYERDSGSKSERKRERERVTTKAINENKAPIPRCL